MTKLEEAAALFIPGLMARYGIQGYSDSSMIAEAFSLAEDFLNFESDIKEARAGKGRRNEDSIPD